MSLTAATKVGPSSQIFQSRMNEVGGDKEDRGLVSGKGWMGWGLEVLGLGNRGGSGRGVAGEMRESGGRVGWGFELGLTKK